MKKLSEIMDELGFDPDGSQGVKEAFIKYLIRTSEGAHVLTPTEKNLIKDSGLKTIVQPTVEGTVANQMQFDFMADPGQKSMKPARKRAV